MSADHYTCEGCGETRMYRVRRGVPTPTHCRFCTTIERGPRTGPVVPATLAVEGLCSQVGDVHLFYPERGGSPKEAKAVCAECPVAALCLEYAIAANEYGVWGGTTERQRGKIRTRRRAAAA